MKVYIAFAHFNDDRIDAVLGVFSNRENAELCMLEATKGDWWTMDEFEVQNSYLMERST